MILRLEKEPVIENLRHYPAGIVEQLRDLLTAGARAYPDPHRREFYDVENGTRMFYIHICPSRKIWLLASWLKSQPEAVLSEAATLAIPARL